jgi:hypothetical protein
MGWLDTVLQFYIAAKRLQLICGLVATATLTDQLILYIKQAGTDNGRVLNSSAEGHLDADLIIVKQGGAD